MYSSNQCVPHFPQGHVHLPLEAEADPEIGVMKESESWYDRMSPDGLPQTLCA